MKFLPSTRLNELACPKCGAAMSLVRVNPHTTAFPTPPVLLWICAVDGHRVVPGLEGFKQAGT